MLRSLGWFNLLGLSWATAVFVLSTAYAFLEIQVMHHPFRRLTTVTTITTFQRHQPLFLAGFGSATTTTSGGSGAKEKKLKPKQQWDRYNALRQESKFRVAVRVANADPKGGNDNERSGIAASNSSGEWLEVGRVRSKDNSMTEFAVARQRGLIVEHARRLFPLQISLKDRIEWAFWRDETEEWVLVDTKQQYDLPEQWDKQIGFEGRPDPASGYYCYYNEGRLVTDESEVDALSKRKVK